MYVLKCGQGMAEHAGRRSPDAGIPNPAGRSDRSPRRRRHPGGRYSDRRRSDGQPGFFNRGIPAGSQTAGQPCLRGNHHCGGSLHDRSPAELRPEPLRPDRGHDRALGADEVSGGKQGRQSGGQTGAVHLCGQPAQPYPDPERHPRLVGADGGFLLRLKACHAACRTVCHARGWPGAYHGEGREVSGNHRPGGYHCV